MAEELDVPPAQSAGQSARLKADLAAGQTAAADWLSTGCPVCHAPITLDTPVHQSSLPGLYPALRFHYGTMHDGVTPPPAPHPEDETALDTQVVKGVTAIGHPRYVSYRQAIAEAVVEWHAGMKGGVR